MTLIRYEDKEPTKKGKNLFEKLVDVQKNVVERSPRTLSLLLDKSDSMAEGCSDGRSKMAQLIDAVRGVHGRYHKQVAIDFTAFNTSTYTLVFPQVLELQPRGGTAIYAALETLMTKYPGSQAILVTDGECFSPSESLDRARKLAGRVVVHTVACGEDTNESLLMQIAEITGGKFFKAGNPIDLPDVFQQLAARAVAALTDGS